jgi:hypothetical protein
LSSDFSIILCSIMSEVIVYTLNCGLRGLKRKCGCRKSAPFYLSDGRSRLVHLDYIFLACTISEAVLPTGGGSHSHSYTTEIQKYGKLVAVEVGGMI